MTRYIWKTDVDTWGSSVSEQEQERLQEVAQNFFDTYEDDYRDEDGRFEVLVESVRPNEATGLYKVTATGNHQILGYTIPAPEVVATLVNMAWEHALVSVDSSQLL